MGIQASRVLLALLSAALVASLHTRDLQAQESESEPTVPVEIRVDCGGDPELVTVINRTPYSIVVESVGSLHSPSESEPFERSDEVYPSVSFTYFASPNLFPYVPETMAPLARRFIFEESEESEGVRVVLGVYGGPRIQAVVQCDEGERTFHLPVMPPSKDVPQDVPDTGGGGARYGAGSASVPATALVACGVALGVHRLRSRAQRNL